ncbi:MAG: FAD-dependent oxidoreductase, partial [Myxococcales bacterium]|nr:FAD-dependent oxidoreductase [Myxococcales bacterium]
MSMFSPRPRVAVVGGGVAGLAAALELQGAFDVTLFERARLGGHIAPLPIVDVDGQQRYVDGGFILFSEAAYPQTCRFLQRLGVEVEASRPSLVVDDRARGLAFARADVVSQFGASLSAQCGRDYMGLMKLVLALRDRGHPGVDDQPLGELLAARGVHPDLRDCVLVPELAAPWGLAVEQVLAMSAHTALETMLRHFTEAQAETRGRPRLMIKGSTIAYLQALTAALTRVGVRVVREGVARVDVDGRGVQLRFETGVERFDAAVLAVPADAALAMLGAPEPAQAAALGAVGYEDKLGILHSDARLLARDEPLRSAEITYARRTVAGRTLGISTWRLDQIHGLTTAAPTLLTLGDPELLAAGVIASDQLREVLRFRHCTLGLSHRRAIDALARLNDRGPIFFAGAYFGATAIHESAYTSAVAAAGALRRLLEKTPPTTGE